MWKTRLFSFFFFSSSSMCEYGHHRATVCLVCLPTLGPFNLSAQLVHGSLFVLAGPFQSRKPSSRYRPLPSSAPCPRLKVSLLRASIGKALPCFEQRLSAIQRAWVPGAEILVDVQSGSNRVLVSKLASSVCGHTCLTVGRSPVIGL